MSYVLAFVGFAALIVLHEAGHFAAAKAVGMRVERFALFFPPLIFKIRRGETEYGIGAVPLGGYVRITGMNPHEEIPPEVAHRAYFRQPVWKRIVVILAGPVVNIVLAFLILGGVFLANGTNRATNVVDPAVELAEPARGVLQGGDRIISADGKTGDFETIRAAIGSHECAGEQTDGCRAATPVKLVVERDGREIPLSIYPRYNAQADRPLLGFSPRSLAQDAGPARASGLAASEMWRITTLTVDAIARIFDAEKRKEISSVVGTYKVTQESFDFSTTRAIYLLGVISLSLGILNLFPFLPLDGGHIFWALAEKVRGKPIPFWVMERAGLVGFALVLGLFAIGLTNDINRFTGEGFDVR